jgi:hypothetical protein
VRLFHVLPIVCAGVFLVVGCSSTGTPVASSSTSSTPSSPPSTSSAPAISHPLDVTKFLNDPCSAFTTAQLVPYAGAISGTSGKQADSNGDVNCVWDPVDVSQPAIGVVVYPDLGGPQNLDAGSYPWHQRTTDIAGYPAEHNSLVPSGPNAGSCWSVIAVSDKAAIGVTLNTTTTTQKYYSDPCVPTDALLTQLVASIKAGS